MSKTLGAPFGGRITNGFGCGTLRQSGSVIGACFGGRIGRTSPTLYCGAGGAGCGGPDICASGTDCVAACGCGCAGAHAPASRARPIAMATTTDRRQSTDAQENPSITFRCFLILSLQ